MHKDYSKGLTIAFIFLFIQGGLVVGYLFYMQHRNAEDKAQFDNMMNELKSNMHGPVIISPPPIIEYNINGPGGGGGGFTKNNVDDFLKPPQVTIPSIGEEGGFSLGGNIAKDSSKSNDTEGSHDTQPLNQTKPKD